MGRNPLPGIVEDVACCKLVSYPAMTEDLREFFRSLAVFRPANGAQSRPLFVVPL